jgi:lysozyme family protein
LTVALAAIVAVVAFMAGTAVAEAKPSRATVIAVQKKLGVPADGVLGPKTRRAVKRFQRSNGLTVDGVIGPQTLSALGLRGRKASRRAVVDDPEALLAKIAECESGGDPAAVSPDGRYRGKYQFSRATWRSLGGEGDPAKAPEAEQDRLARILLDEQGPDAWPHCSNA